MNKIFNVNKNINGTILILRILGSSICRTKSYNDRKEESRIKIHLYKHRQFIFNKSDTYFSPFF